MLKYTFIKYDTKIQHESPTITTRSFQLGYESIARLFDTIYHCGIQSVSYLAENPREYLLMSMKTYILISEKTTALYYYDNYVCVMIYGYLKINFDLHLKIISFVFKSHHYEELYPRNMSISLPDNWLNEFGLPPDVMRYFEVVEGLLYMKEIILFGSKYHVRPKVALKKIK